MGRRFKGGQKKGSDMVSAESIDPEVKSQEKELEEPALPFLLMEFPQGFFTGCIMYMMHYSLMIGHWKIALGMVGMWILLMLNHEAVIIQQKEQYPLWKVLGLCLVEGWIIEAAGWFFRSQKIRLYYFIVLGIITVMIQLVNLFRMSKERRMREDNQSENEK